MKAPGRSQHFLVCFPSNSIHAHRCPLKRDVTGCGQGCQIIAYVDRALLCPPCSLPVLGELMEQVTRNLPYLWRSKWPLSLAMGGPYSPSNAHMCIHMDGNISDFPLVCCHCGTSPHWAWQALVLALLLSYLASNGGPQERLHPIFCIPNPWICLTWTVTILGKGCRVLAPPSMAMPKVGALFVTRIRWEVGASRPG